jgi:predicted nuclease of predicted toxin-antitoxin system
MRLLLDSRLWGPAAEELRIAGHDVLCIAEKGKDPGDEEILQQSIREDRVLVTLDEDFGELVFALGRPHRGILRLVNTRANQQARIIGDVLKKHGDELLARALIVVTPDRIRIRMPEESDIHPR